MRSAPLVALAVLGLAACDAGTAAGPPTLSAQASRQAVLATVGEHLILPTLAAFVTDAEALAAASRRGSPADAQRAFAAAFTRWQALEVLQVGPAGDPLARAGGRGLRDAVYSWPAASPCRLDQEVAAGGQDAPDYFETRLVNAYGLDAIEYLLWAPPGQNACPPQVAPNSDGAWAALGRDEIARRRATLAARLADRVVEDARTLHAAWAAAGLDFAGALARAGQPGSPYASVQAGLDELFAALFYVDLMTKDAKVGDVGGFTAGCRQAACPENAESPHAGLSREALTANLRALRAVVAGTTLEGEARGPGLADLARELGAADLATTLLAAVDEALGEVAALPGPLQTLPAESLRPLYVALKKLTDLMKSQLVTVLNLSVPQEGAADND